MLLLTDIVILLTGVLLGGVLAMRGVYYKLKRTGRLDFGALGRFEGKFVALEDGDGE